MKCCGKNWLALLACLIGLANPARAQTNASVDTGTNRRIFQVKGVVEEVKAESPTLVIRHQAVADYMPAMTMPFDVKNPDEKRGLQRGDRISFQLVVAGDDAWIEHIKKIDGAGVMELPSRSSFQQVRDVDLLQIGDLLPEYHFTNELGRPVSTKQFLGGPFAFTFFFTRCPYPAFCPLLSRNFAAAEKKLRAMPAAPSRWHLLSISFDTEHDTPAILKNYAASWHYDPAHWSFVTGDRLEINAIGDQVGQYFGHDESGGVTHNLRTVVVDARGRIQKIFPNNTWTGDELADEMIRGAAIKQP